MRYGERRRCPSPGEDFGSSASSSVPSSRPPPVKGCATTPTEIGEQLPPGSSWPKPGELPEQGAEIEASELFDVVDVSHFDWEIVYDADGYIDLLNTFSGHIAMQPWQRDRLYSEIRRRLAARADGRLRRHWGAVLHIARRRE